MCEAKFWFWQKYQSVFLQTYQLPEANQFAPVAEGISISQCPFPNAADGISICQGFLGEDTPPINTASLQLENGKTFTIEAINQSPKNVYVQKVLLNGKPLPSYFISHSDILAGGKLTFHMGAKPKK